MSNIEVGEQGFPEVADILLVLTETFALSDAHAGGVAKPLGDTLGYTDAVQVYRPGLGVLTIVIVVGLGDSVGKGGGKG